jgi:hypothetical protein
MSEQANAPKPQGGCACMGAGPTLTEILRKLGPDESVRQHFQNARIEFLKGIRALVDQRIQDLSRSAPKGAKIVVE